MTGNERDYVARLRDALNQALLCVADAYSVPMNHGRRDATEWVEWLERWHGKPREWRAVLMEHNDADEPR